MSEYRGKVSKSETGVNRLEPSDYKTTFVSYSDHYGKAINESIDSMILRINTLEKKEAEQGKTLKELRRKATPK